MDTVPASRIFCRIQTHNQKLESGEWADLEAVGLVLAAVVGL
jgi:hypothetical protein